jgi:hypothetical protein
MQLIDMHVTCTHRLHSFDTPMADFDWVSATAGRNDKQNAIQFAYTHRS